MFVNLTKLIRKTYIRSKVHICQCRDYDDPHLKAFQFCKLHKLNKLAINIVEDKIREAMQFEEQKLAKNKGKPKQDQGKLTKGENNLSKSQRRDTNKK